jgi:hypothetical protein
MDRATAERQTNDLDERPPFGRSWGLWYAAVLVHLALLIALFAWLTRLYATS